MPLLKVVSKNAIRWPPWPSMSSHTIKNWGSPSPITNSSCLVWSADQFGANNKRPCLLVTNYVTERCRPYIKRKVQNYCQTAIFWTIYQWMYFTNVHFQNTRFVTVSLWSIYFINQRKFVMSWLWQKRKYGKKVFWEFPWWIVLE